MVNMIEWIFSIEVLCTLDDSHVSFLFLYFSLLAHTRFLCAGVPLTEVLGSPRHAALCWGQAPDEVPGTGAGFCLPPVLRGREEKRHASLLVYISI